MWSTYCHLCFGDGCDECNEGEVIMKRCPNSFNRDNVKHLYKAFVFFHNHKVLPNEGGYSSQSDNFCKVLEFSSFVQRKIYDEKKKIEDSKRKM